MVNIKQQMFPRQQKKIIKVICQMAADIQSE